MEAMVMDVVNGAPIPLDVKSARLKATLLIVFEAVMNNRITRLAVATSKREGDLYVLERGNFAFVYVFSSATESTSPLDAISPAPVSATNLAPSTAPMDQIPAITSSAPSGSHPTITRAKSRIFKTRHPAHLSFVQSIPFIHALLATSELTGFKSAAKNPAWLAVMDDEMKALQINHTWDLVPRPSNANIVGSKWVFRTKFLSDGSIEPFKARLVAKGYTQLPGLDYTDTFSPVVKAFIVRVVLSLAVSHKWPLRQFDIKNAFLNGILHETIYMEQLLGYVDPRHPLHVCKLKKTLYSLKQGVAVVRDLKHWLQSSDKKLEAANRLRVNKMRSTVTDGNKVDPAKVSALLDASL
eukprot:XP_010656738.1 PREDICTED: uncharacterized protein LOC104880761 [Vitis vinifera]